MQQAEEQYILLSLKKCAKNEKHVLAGSLEALRITKQFISFNDKESNNALWTSFYNHA